ncbi:hypothetical protein HLRTI_001852 [Halorhabdus tiamatea SARL4B]|uniref:Cox cluster protein n=1 Tax=Halorhabdus tiamatea SARL4B TaxID=1033806 RepID=F7PQH5_9EURY|nr:hypothetical protein [Halorhabdus tiamatea]ERJ06089.1 hypothetical protein HLRTI_001852 [Halorhabdus tiamatea SARL4B]CCQ33281.1 hypothetical protein HTIA_1143 [Halorhabdus tiamatea SARL4B]
MSTTTNTDETLADQIAMALGGGLMILGVVILGLIEVFSGKPYSPIADGSVAAGVTIDPYWRALLITIGGVILMLYAIYVVLVRGLLGQRSI